MDSLQGEIINFVVVACNLQLPKKVFYILNKLFVGNVLIFVDEESLWEMFLLCVGTINIWSCHKKKLSFIFGHYRWDIIGF